MCVWVKVCACVVRVDVVALCALGRDRHIASPYAFNSPLLLACSRSHCVFTVTLHTKECTVSRLHAHAHAHTQEERRTYCESVFVSVLDADFVFLDFRFFISFFELLLVRGADHGED